VRRIPSRASRSMTGVRIVGWPYDERSPYPWSSVRITTMLGRSGVSPCWPARSPGAIRAVGTIMAARNLRVRILAPFRGERPLFPPTYHMPMRAVVVTLLLAFAAFARSAAVAQQPAAGQPAASLEVDVLVYGGTSAGVIAAYTARR